MGGAPTMEPRNDIQAMGLGQARCTHGTYGRTAIRCRRAPRDRGDAATSEVAAGQDATRTHEVAAIREVGAGAGGGPPQVARPPHKSQKPMWTPQPI